MKTIHVAKSVEFPLSFVTSTAAILAMRGQGKTHLAKVIVEEMLKHGAQVVIGDPTGAWWGLTSSASGKRAGFDVVVFGGDHAHIPINENSGPLIADTIVSNQISAVLDVSGFEHDSERVRFMAGFARRLFYINRRPLHFVLDEADEFVPQQPERDQIAMLSILKRIWQRARIKGIGGTLISQRAAVVHKTLLNMSETLIALRTVGPQDRKALESWFNSWGTPEQIDEFASTISNVPDYHAWFWSPRFKLFALAKARALESFDSSATPDVDASVTGPERRSEIDVEKLGAQIAKLAEEAKDNDPAELRKRATHYQEQFEIATKRMQLLEQRLKEWKKRKPPTRTLTAKPAISAKTLKRVESAIKSVEKLRKNIDGTLKVAAEVMAADLDKAFDTLSKELRKVEPLARPLPAIESTVDEDDLVYDVDAATGKRDSEPYRRVPVDVGKRITKGGGQRNILIALAQHGPLRISKVKALAGIAKPTTMATYISRLLSAGQIRREGDTITITAMGRTWLGHYDPLPTGRALIDFWRGEVGSGGMGKIFAILSSTPNRLDPSDVMKRAGIESPTTFATYVSRLKRFEIIETGKDWIGLAEDLREHAA